MPILGDESRLLDLVREVQPDVVLFTAGSSASAGDSVASPGSSRARGGRHRGPRRQRDLRRPDPDAPVAGLPLVHMDLPRSRKALKKGKRIFDVVAGAALLLLLSPVFAVIALCIRLGDGGAVIFRQERVGRSGEPIEFLKFRSMVLDAEARLAELRQRERDRGNDVLFKMADDPRITRVGRCCVATPSTSCPSCGTCCVAT